jgi:acyl transferase domain-containing protein
MGIPNFITTPAESIDIAVVGLACRFPGASSEKKLWELLSNKRCTRFHAYAPKEQC